jgi:hypothetical protein
MLLAISTERQPTADQRVRGAALRQESDRIEREIQDQFDGA